MDLTDLLDWLVIGYWKQLFPVSRSALFRLRSSFDSFKSSLKAFLWKHTQAGRQAGRHARTHTHTHTHTRAREERIY